MASFPVAALAADASPAYLWLQVWCEPGAMFGSELEETGVRAITAAGLRLLLPVKVTGYPADLLRGPAWKRRRNKWRKAFNDGPHHVSRYRRLGKQQDRRRARHAIDQALRTGRYTMPAGQGSLPRHLLAPVPPRGLEDVYLAPDAPPERKQL